MIQQFLQKPTAIVFLTVVILLAGVFVRLLNLSQFPSILNRDEAALAYNAKLIREVQKDEWGQFLPLQFISFGDYKLPGYIYTLVPFFFILGEHDWVVRLPSTLAGIGIIVVGSILAIKLINSTQKKETDIQYLVSLILFSFTPVFFFYSRMAWEANLGLFFLLSAIYVVMVKTERFYFQALVSSILMLLSVFTYNAPLLLLPFLLVLPACLHGVKNRQKWVPLTVGWCIVLLIGGASLLSVANQKSGISIFTDETITLAYPVFRQQFPTGLQSILGNKYVYWGTLMGERFFNTFSYSFAVTQGGAHPWHSILGRGHLYWSIYVFFIIGLLYQLIKIVQIIKFLISNYSKNKLILDNRLSSIKHQALLLYLLVVSPLPAIITTDAPHATRSLFTFYMMMVMAMYGFSTLLHFFYQRQKHIIFITLFLVIFTAESMQYFYQYFYLWQDQYDSALLIDLPRTLKKIETEYPDQPTAVIDGGGYDYILFAWYSKYSAQEFLSTIKHHLPDTIGLRYGYRVGNYRFIRSPLDREENEKVLITRDGSEWRIETF